MSDVPPSKTWKAHFGDVPPGSIPPPTDEEWDDRTSAEALSDLEFEVEPDRFEVRFTGRPPPWALVGFCAGFVATLLFLWMAAGDEMNLVGIFFLATHLGPIPCILLGLMGHVLALDRRPCTHLDVNQHRLRIAPAGGSRVDIPLETVRSVVRTGGMLVVRSEHDEVAIPVGGDPTDSVDAVIERIEGLKTRVDEGAGVDPEARARSQAALAKLQRGMSGARRGTRYSER